MNVPVPKLEHDAMMAREFGTQVSASGRRERRIVAALIAHLITRGFHVRGVYDGETYEKAHDAKSAMEFIFNLDEASLRVGKRGLAEHGILLVLGNDMDIITDWNYFVGDRDGFNAAMEAFDAEQYA